MYYNLRRVFKTSAESLEKIHEDDIPRTIIKRKKKSNNPQNLCGVFYLVGFGLK